MATSPIAASMSDSHLLVSGEYFLPLISSAGYSPDCMGHLDHGCIVADLARGIFSMPKMP